MPASFAKFTLSEAEGLRTTSVHTLFRQAIKESSHEPVPEFRSGTAGAVSKRTCRARNGRRVARLFGSRGERQNALRNEPGSGAAVRAGRNGESGCGEGRNPHGGLGIGRRILLAGRALRVARAQEKSG